MRLPCWYSDAMTHDLVFATMSSDIVRLTYQVQRLLGDSHKIARACALDAARRHMEALEYGEETPVTLNALGVALDDMAKDLSFPN